MRDLVFKSSVNREFTVSSQLLKQCFYCFLLSKIFINNAYIPFMERSDCLLGYKSVNAGQGGIAIPYPEVRWIRGWESWDAARAGFALSRIISNVSTLRTR